MSILMYQKGKQIREMDSVPVCWEWIKNIQADCFWRSLACKRYQRYFDCMKAIVKMMQHDIIGLTKVT